jgi:hypothetical protein
VQQAPEHVPSTVRADVEERLGVALEGVEVHRDESSAAAADDLSARAFTAGGRIHLPAHHGPLDAPPARSLLAHELVHVAQQRRLPRELPGEESALGRALEADATWMEHAVRGWSQASTAAQPSVLAAVGADSASAEPGPLPSTRLLTSGHNAVQRAPEVAPADPSSSTDQDAEEQASRLYPHIRTQLLGELLVDRERSGLATDVR